MTLIVLLIFLYFLYTDKKIGLIGSYRSYRSYRINKYVSNRKPLIKKKHIKIKLTLHLIKN